MHIHCTISLFCPWHKNQPNMETFSHSSMHCPRQYSTVIWTNRKTMAMVSGYQGSLVITRSETGGLSPIISVPSCLLPCHLDMLPLTGYLLPPLITPLTTPLTLTSSPAMKRNAPIWRTCCLISITGEDTVATLRISRDCFPLLSLLMIDCYKLSSATATTPLHTVGIFEKHAPGQYMTVSTVWIFIFIKMPPQQ